MGNPTYITLTSSGSSPWWSTNWRGVSDFNIGLAVNASTSVTGNWQIDVTMDDPFGVFPSTIGSSAPLVFQSSQIAGGSTAVAGFGPAGSSVSTIGNITAPIQALRLTTASTGGVTTLTVLQSGRA